MIVLLYVSVLCTLCSDVIIPIIWCILHSFLVQPGTPNPVVKLFVVDTNNTMNITEVVVPALFSSR